MEEFDTSAHRALLQALGEYGEDLFPQTEREVLVPVLLQTYRDHPDAGLHAAAEWLLRRWGQEERLREIDRDLANGRVERGWRWYVNREGQTFVVVSATEFLMGSPLTEARRDGGPEGQMERLHRCRIDRTFVLAAKEVTLGQFLRFRADCECNRGFSPTLEHPVNNVSWNEAAEYCNWLSARDGIPPEEWCYEVQRRAGLPLAVHPWPNFLERTGYRLPTEAEWEFAARAGATTARHFGEADNLLEEYAWYQKNTQERSLMPPGMLKPNDFGLFDMLGNVLEWCQDPYRHYPAGRRGGIMEDNGENNTNDSVQSRILRGGAFSYQAPGERSANRIWVRQDGRNFVIGFRPGRTLR
jgi:formylglycine-generating enzyme required for sulfatase activity